MRFLYEMTVTILLCAWVFVLGFFVFPLLFAPLSFVYFPKFHEWAMESWVAYMNWAITVLEQFGS